MELELPLSHELPFYQHDHPRYDRQLGAIAAELGGPVVDIGANVGDTAAAIRAESDVPILCVEGDPAFFALLERNARAIGGVELERAFVEGPPAAGSSAGGDRACGRGRRRAPRRSRSRRSSTSTLRSRGRR